MQIVTMEKGVKKNKNTENLQVWKTENEQECEKVKNQINQIFELWMLIIWCDIFWKLML